MEILIFLIISYILFSGSLYLLFPKANKEAWKGLVPVLNFLTLQEIVDGKSSTFSYLSSIYSTLLLFAWRLFVHSNNTN